MLLVTGATSGIGAAVARALTTAGAVVVGTGRDPAALAELAMHTRGPVLEGDLAVPGTADRVVGAVLDRCGRLDGLVAAAGIGHAGPVTHMSEQQLRELLDLDVTGTLDLARSAATAMVARPAGERARGGAVVFISSIAGAVGVPGETVYSAAKAAVEAFAPLLGEELRPHRITVSTVLPGVVATEFFHRRGAPYDRRFPRPVPADRVAGVVVDVLRTGARRQVVPRWLTLPARFAGATPGLYRALARRLG